VTAQLKKVQEKNKERAEDIADGARKMSRKLSRLRSVLFVALENRSAKTIGKKGKWSFFLRFKKISAE
jgi:hypothetical protein